MNPPGPTVCLKAHRTIPCIETPTRYSDARFDELPFVAPARKDVIMVRSTKTQITARIRHSCAVLAVAMRCGVTTLAVLAGFLAACGEEGAPNVTPDVLEVDGNSSGSGDVGPTLPSCVDNLDCSGGKVCRDGLCREACVIDLDCSGVLPFCDPVAEFC
jgi:hypothetical protein